MAADSIDNAALFTERQKGHLPGLLEMTWQTVRQGLVRGQFTVRKSHLAPNGFLHAASVITPADSACGYGSFTSLPAGATGFTTIELKTNFLGTAREGVVSCEARMVHGGRTTQLWDAEVRHQDSDRVIALFRCTQAVLWPKT